MTEKKRQQSESFTSETLDSLSNQFKTQKLGTSSDKTRDPSIPVPNVFGRCKRKKSGSEREEESLFPKKKLKFDRPVLTAKKKTVATKIIDKGDNVELNKNDDAIESNRDTKDVSSKSGKGSSRVTLKSTRKTKKKSCKKGKKMEKRSNRTKVEKRGGDEYDDNRIKIQKVNDPDWENNLRRKEEESKLEERKVLQMLDFKEKGNNAMKEKKYETALHFYNKALSVDPKNSKFNSLFYGNAGVAYIRMEDYPNAIEYLEKSIQLDGTNIKARKNRIICLKELQELEEAEMETRKLIEITDLEVDRSLLREIQEMRADEFVADGEVMANEDSYKQALVKYTSVLESLKTAAVLVKRANVYILLQLFENAELDLEEALSINPDNLEAKRLKITLFELNGTNKNVINKAIADLNEKDPSEHSRQLLKKMFINLGVGQTSDNELTVAYDSFTSAINMFPDDVMLYYYRSDIAFRLKDMKKTISDCTTAIDLGTHELSFWILRSRALLKEKLYQAAYNDYVTVADNMMDSDVEILMDDVMQGYKMMKTETYYDILGVSITSSAKEMRKQYLKLSLKYHPDKINSYNDYIKKAYQERFRLINESYNTLSDPKNKHAYDVVTFSGRQ